MAEKAQGLSPAGIKGRIITAFRDYGSVLDDCALINMKRLFYLSLIAVPMRILDLFLFAGATGAWGSAIILSHWVLLIFYSGVFVVTLRLRNAARATVTIHVLQYIIPSMVMASGIAVVTIDQLVTTNITPLIIVSIVFGALFLIRPLVSALIYLVAYMAYYYAIALTITSPEVLLSNRVNGATIIALGFLISVMSWHYNYTNITQSRRIEAQQEQLKQMAYSDSLTGLYNRHYFDKAVEKELSSVRRYGHESVLIMLDIDDFKKINDAHGHLTGDAVLVEFAGLITANVRRSDTVSRFGGEEFVILAPNISLEDGVALAEKLRGMIAEQAFTTGRTTSHITASFGVSLLQEATSKGPEGYLTLADKSLYRAKQRGKNRVEKAVV